MKRKNNLYQNICKIENILAAYNEVCKNTKNQNRVEKYKAHKTIYVANIHRILESKSYLPGKYHVFTIYEPKERRIVSQNMDDKIINHLVARYILYPAILPCLLDVNVASRKNLGTKAGLDLAQNFHRKCKIKYKTYYILKCDISKFFYSINHENLKNKIRKKIKDKDALKIIFDIINSEENGLSIGAMTSQVLAIFYLNDMDHFIKEKLKIKYYIRYQDDFLLFHPSKQYLKYCLKELIAFLGKEHLVLNRKTRIYKNTNNFIFLGRDSKGNYAKYRTVRRKLKRKLKLYKSSKTNLQGIANSIICYKGLLNTQNIKLSIN